MTGEGEPPQERPPSVDIIEGFNAILKPKEDEEGQINSRQFGEFEVRRATMGVGWQRQVLKTTYELTVNGATAAESRRYAYQRTGMSLGRGDIYIDGTLADPDEGERLLQAEIKRALIAYERQGSIFRDRPEEPRITLRLRSFSAKPGVPLVSLPTESAGSVGDRETLRIRSRQLEICEKPESNEA